MDFYSFLYLTNINNPNLKSQNFKKNVEVYFKNALNLYNLRHQRREPFFYFRNSFINYRPAWPAPIAASIRK